MTFVAPWWLLSALVGLWCAYRIKSRRMALGIPNHRAFGSGATSSAPVLTRLGEWVRPAALILLSVALARPVGRDAPGAQDTEGIDIVLVVDTSKSMQARDFLLEGERPTRLDVVKAVIGQFITARRGDRIGMVVFGSDAYTQAPLTLDHQMLQQFLRRIHIGMAGPATAIGDGLATAVKRLQDADSKSRVVIMLTDGGNTSGRVEPLSAAAAAQEKGVRVYTIGVGSDGEEPVVENGQVKARRLDIDEALLKQIADDTAGAYFHAQDTETLVRVYATIDKLERTRVKMPEAKRFDDLYAGVLTLALVLLGVEVVWSASRYRRLP